jgi:hypothetical protein
MTLELPEFRFDAICSQTDPEAFYPEKGGSTKEAKRICLGCPVREQCLQYALDHDERYGVWGGMSERDRRRLQRAADCDVPVEVELAPFEPEKYTRADGHGYRGYRKGCKCGICKAGYASYHYDYARRSGNREVRKCETCDAEVFGRGGRRYCSDACKMAAKQERAQARTVAA